MLAFFTFDVIISIFESASKNNCFRYFFQKVQRLEFQKVPGSEDGQHVEVTSKQISKMNVLNYVDVIFVIVLCVAIGAQ